MDWSRKVNPVTALAPADITALNTTPVQWLGGQTATATITVNVLAPIDTWRQTHFGTTQNTGTAADTFDADGDGESNLLEFATGQSPLTNTRLSTPFSINGANLEYTYTRANAALADGITFTVEWSDTLAPGSWSTAGVTQQILSDNGTVQTVKATLPAGTLRRFARLRVTTTP